MLKLFQGDAVRIMRQFDPNTFDAIITDPPYSSGGSSLTDKLKAPAEKYTNKKTSNFANFEGETMDQRTWTLFMTDALQYARRACKPEAVCVIFVDWRQYPVLSDAMQRAGWSWRGVCVWDKLNSRPQKGRFRQQAEFIVWGSNGKLPIDRPCPILPGVFSYPNVPTKDRYHMTQKPIALMRDLIKITLPGGHILDPFMGSGSTLDAAVQEGYSATGIELSPEIAKIAAHRLDAPLTFTL